MRFLRRLFGVLALVLWAGSASAYDVELRWGHVTTYWERINMVLLSIAEKVAMDDDWLQKLKDMKPVPGAGKAAGDVATAIAGFRGRVDRFNATKKVDPASVHRRDLAPDGSLAAAYLDSGFLLDAIVLQVVKNDPVRVIGQYFPRFEAAKGDLAETFGEVVLADERLKAIMTELGVK